MNLPIAVFGYLENLNGSSCANGGHGIKKKNFRDCNFFANITRFIRGQLLAFDHMVILGLLLMIVGSDHD